MSEQLARLEERTKQMLSLLQETRKDVAEIRKSANITGLRVSVRVTRLETSQRLCLWLLGTFGVTVIGVIVERMFH